MVTLQIPSNDGVKDLNGISIKDVVQTEIKGVKRAAKGHNKQA